MLDVVRFWLDLGPRRVPPRRRALPVRARRHQRREPARDPRVPAAGCARRSTPSYPGRVLLAEANQWPADVVDYFGDGDECHMCFHFPLMPRMFMAVRREQRYPITEILAQTPGDPRRLPVGHLPAQPRRADPRDGHRRGARLHVRRVRQGPADEAQHRHRAGACSRCSTTTGASPSCSTPCCSRLPGSPVLYYGDEIGMGDNIYLGDRDGVRTPMQWTPDRNGGFSPGRLRPAVPAAADGPGLRLPGRQRRGRSCATRARSCTGCGACSRCAREHPVFGTGQLRGARASRTRRCWPTCARQRRDDGDRRHRAVRQQPVAGSPSRSSCLLSELAGKVPVELLGPGATSRRSASCPTSSPWPPYGFYWFSVVTTDPRDGRRS